MTPLVTCHDLQSGSEVHWWIVQLDHSFEELLQTDAWSDAFFSDNEGRQLVEASLHRYHQESDRRAKAASALLQRHIARAVLKLGSHEQAPKHVMAAPITMRTDPPNFPFGKPYWDLTQQSEVPWLSRIQSYLLHNVSHDRDVISFLYGILPTHVDPGTEARCPNDVIGTDVQHTNRLRHDQTVDDFLDGMTHQLTRNEIIWVNGVHRHLIPSTFPDINDDNARLLNFTVLWTIKEAILKALGWGLAVDPKSLSITPPADMISSDISSGWRASLFGLKIPISLFKLHIFTPSTTPTTNAVYRRSELSDFCVATAVAISSSYFAVAGPWNAQVRVKPDVLNAQESRVGEVVPGRVILGDEGPVRINISDMIRYA